MGGGGTGRGVGWKPITHLRVPTTSPCSPPSALPVVRVPRGRRGHAATCCHTPKGAEFRGLMHTLGQVGTPTCLSCRGWLDTVACDTEGLLHHLWCSAAGSGGPCAGPCHPLLLWMSFLAPGRTPQLGSAQLEDGQALHLCPQAFPRYPKPLLPPPLGASPGS